MSIEVNRGNFRAIERVPTVLDERGLVEPIATIRALKLFLDEEGLMPQTLEANDDHHLYWPFNLYKKADISFDDDLATRFRHLRINRVVLPRNVHELLHVHTEPPPVPEEGLMQEYLKSADHLFRMFKMSRSIIGIERDIRRALQQEEVGATRIWPTTDRLLPKSTGAHTALVREIEAYDRTPNELRVMPGLDLQLSVTALANQIGNFLGIRRTRKILRFAEL